MNNNRIKLLVILLIIIGLKAHGQQTEKYSDLRFKSYSLQHGLSQSSVLCMVQDQQGFIWMGTKDGLNRFDGYGFRQFKTEANNPASISNNEIIALMGDFNGDIFIGTRGGGLNKYLSADGTFTRYPELNTYDNTVSAIFCNGNGDIWVGTSDGLFYGEMDKENPHQYSFSNHSTLSSYFDPRGEILPYNRNVFSVVSITPFFDHRLLIGTERGLYIYDPAKKEFKQINGGDSFNISKVNTIQPDQRRDSLYWIGSSEGIVKLHIKKQEPVIGIHFNQQHSMWKPLQINWVDEIISDFDGNIWAGTRGAGLAMIDSTDQVTQFYSDFNQSNRIGDNLINSLLLDKTGVLWIGTESRGGVSLDLYRKKFNHLENHTHTGKNLTNNLVTAITGNKNTIWVGTAFNGLDKLEFTTNKTIETTHIKAIPDGTGRTSNEIISLLLDRQNNLWVGSASNNIVAYREKEGFKNYTVGGFVFALHQDQDDDIWMGTWGTGLGLFDKQTNSVKIFNNTGLGNHSLSSDKILSLYDDHYGLLWIGTKGGGLNIIPLNMIKQGYQNYTSYKHLPNDNNSLSHNDVNCIIQDTKNNYWLGTGNGLCRISLTGKDVKETLLQGKATFKTYTSENGLAGNVVYGILEDQQGILWISTINGLSKFDPVNEEFQNFDTNDGVQSNEFHSNAYYKSPDYRMFFGGEKGLTFFRPDEITPNPFPSNLAISGFKVVNQNVLPHQRINGDIILKNDISATQNITLSPKHKEFTIEFSALHYANPEGVQYAYRMLGFNEEWRYASGNERSATYTNLWEGTYIFQVISSNNDGVWNTEPREIKVIIRPPYWRNPWFYLVYIAIIVIGLLLFRRYSLIAVSEKNRLVIERIERKNLIENTEAKMRFFTNISHEIRTPLTLISNPIEEVISKGQIDEQSKNKLKLASKNVARLLQLTNQLLQLRRIDKGGIEPRMNPVQLSSFVRDITGYFEQKAQNKSISLRYQFDIAPTEQIWLDAEMITTAIYNILSNSFKFTPDGGEIGIRVFKQEKSNDKKAKVLTNPMYGIEISDTGLGVEKQDIEKIFMRFYQGKTEVETAGSGIGLSLVKEYIDLHKGYIDIVSTPGKGTKITLLLPSGQKPVGNQDTDPITPAAKVGNQSTFDEDQDSNLDLESENTNDSQLALPKVLVVEDDRDLAQYLADSIAPYYRTAICHNGKTGLEKAREWEPHLIISDVMMPEMTGTEMCSAIKSDIETSHIPIILLTAKASDENTIEGYQSGADLYVTKPFVLDVLETQIKQLLQTRKQLQDKYSKQILLKPRDITITSIDEHFLEKLNTIIEENLGETDFDVTAMVKKMNMSHSTVLKKVKALTDMPLVEFVKNQRLKRAAQILLQDKLQIAEVAYMVGFSDPKYFSKCFSKAFGMTPSEYVATRGGENNKEAQKAE